MSYFPADVPLFYVPTGLRRILDRDLEVAGIAKKDDRDRTIDVHALRHTFGTMLSQKGVAPRTAQAAMRHSRIDLTMNVYTDARLLDVAGALESLPSLPVDGDLNRSQHEATGTDGAEKLPPMLPPGAVQTGQSEASAVTSVKANAPNATNRCDHETGSKPTKKASLPTNGNKAFQRARRDLNSQPPDRQSGALTN